MATLTVRNLDDEVKELLRIAAAKKGHSMEEEARLILKQALTSTPPDFGLGSHLRQRFAALNTPPLELPPK
ncbi:MULTISPECIES: plasmid stabilization protein [Rahnella]|uniref:Plasmid stabilization protein n=1 Tax=Rahnella laticis TaxID=2787622 RepID=A0ABS0E6C7_9GAMM|nr:MULTISPECIES: plasmid stabilization protein [Rahnella]MBF7980662.1 plasmid stabilization protein [Rahnella laticis]MBF8000753.1 plasmid stabilization protein [Rahnella sp. LAC-M12]